MLNWNVSACSKTESVAYTFSCRLFSHWFSSFSQFWKWIQEANNGFFVLLRMPQWQMQTNRTGVVQTFQLHHSVSLFMYEMHYCKVPGEQSPGAKHRNAALNSIWPNDWLGSGGFHWLCCTTPQNTDRKTWIHSESDGKTGHRWCEVLESQKKSSVFLNNYKVGPSGAQQRLSRRNIKLRFETCAHYRIEMSQNYWKYRTAKVQRENKLGAMPLAQGSCDAVKDHG